MTASRSFVGCIIVAVGASFALAGCGADQPGAAAEAAAEHEQPALGVALDDDEARKLGVAVAPIAAAAYQPYISGTARVVDAQAAIAVLADLEKAETEARTSQSALKRARDLFRSDTAVSAEALEAAERQAANDDAQVKVARARASLEFGRGAPWLDASRRESVAAALASGATALVSASFPASLAGAEPPFPLELERMGMAGQPQWSATETWLGPADPSIPGPTVLALVPITSSGLSAGERLGARVASGAQLEGTVVPASAIVLSGGEAWAYLQSGSDFTRRRVDLGRPVADGYFQQLGFTAAEAVVVAGAGLLLARETGGGAEED
jgi:hypothetical protein